MLKSIDPELLELRDGEHITCDHDALLRVICGRVWITRHNDPDDHFLDAGQVLQLHAGARALVSAEPGGARVALQRLARTPARRAGRTIAAWIFPPTSSP